MRRLSTDLVDIALVRFPAPAADSVRALVAADGVHERRDRVVECYRAALRTLAAIALAARWRSGIATDGELTRLLQALAARGLTDGQWLGVLRHATGPWRRSVSACPVPELAALLYGSGRRRFWRACDQLLEMRRSETVAHGATGDEARVGEVLTRRLPALERVLEAMVTLFSRYRVVVPEAPRSLIDHRQCAHVLSGDTPVAARWRRVELAGDYPLSPQVPVLLDSAGELILELAPFAIARVEAGLPRALAYVDGHGRRGVRYLELPSARELYRDDLGPFLGLPGEPVQKASLVARALPARGRAGTAAAALVAAAAMALLTFGAGDREPPARHPPVPAEAVAAPSASERAERDERFLADARRALERDPTAALELLAAIDPGGPASGAARVLAAEAVRRGVSARVMQGHRSWIGAVDVSADGAFAVSGGGDGSLRLWNLATGVATPLPGHDGAVLATVISPDGRWIASAGADTTVRVWNVRRKESFVLVGHAGWVDRLCFSPDSRRLLSAGRDRVVRLWHVDDRPALARELTGHRGRIVGVSFARGDRLVVSASADRTLRVWDRRSGRGRSLRGHAAPVAAMAVSAEGAVVSGDEIGVVRAWTPSSGASAVRASLGTPITALAFAGDAIVAGTGDGALWRVPSGGEAIRLHSRAAAVSSVAVLAGHRVTAGYDDGVVVALTDVGVRELRGHEGTVRALASSGGRLVSAAEDGDLRVWRIDRGDRVVHGEERLVAMAATDGGVIAVDVAGAVYRVDPAGERVVGTASGRPVSVAVSTGGMIAVGRGDGAIAIVGSEARALEAHRGPVIGLVFGRDDGILISAGDDGVVRGWDPASGLEAWRVALGSAVTWLGRSPVGMIATTWEGRAFAIDENGRAVGLAPSLDDVAAAAAISADGRHLAVASMGGEVQLVDLESGASTRVRGHKGAIGAVAFSADGSRLATGGAHGTARIWSVEGGALRALGDVHGGDGEIVALAFTEDGRGLITGATGGAVRVWDPESGAHCELRGHVGDVQAIVITTGSVVSLARSGELIWWREALPRWPRG